MEKSLQIFFIFILSLLKAAPPPHESLVVCSAMLVAYASAASDSIVPVTDEEKWDGLQEISLLINFWKTKSSTRTGKHTGTNRYNLIKIQFAKDITV